MKKRLFRLLIAATCMSLAVPLYTVFAQSATNQTWSSEIAYFNTEAASGTLNVTFYDGSGSAHSIDAISLNPHQSGTLLVGSISALGSDFTGSAVLSADVEIAAVYIEFVSGAESNSYDRKIYNGFLPGQASSTFYLPTVLKKAFGATSQIGIQNVSSSQNAELTMEFYAAGQTTPTKTLNETLLPQSSHIFSMNEVAVSDGFTGSLKITSSGGQVVASAEETWDSDRFAYSFEGIASGANRIFVPTMLCRYGPGLSISYYAIQAVGGTAEVVIKHYDRDTGELLEETDPIEISDGAKSSQNPCTNGVADGAIGSSIIESTGAPIIVVVKVADESGGIRTAYLGEGTGSTLLALPYVRWNDDSSAEFLSYIAVMNIGDSNATDIQAHYYNSSGTLIITHVLADADNPLAPLVKVNTHAVAAGAVDGNGNFTGAVIIESDQPVLVTVRAARDVSGLGSINMFAEDYTGIPIGP
jgi:hypothetical protein